MNSKVGILVFIVLSASFLFPTKAKMPHLAIVSPPEPHPRDLHLRQPRQVPVHLRQDGEVTKQRRTLVIPNVAVATYTTEWRYDSHNRLQEMVYPDEEKVRYNYNLGGQLSSVVGEKKCLYKYIDTIGYDSYEQKKYLKYGNGTVTEYRYSSKHRRLSNVDVTSPMYDEKIMKYRYSYDEMDNKTRTNIPVEKVPVD